MLAFPFIISNEFVSSNIGKTKRGELSIFPTSFTVLSHCLHMMPRQKSGPGSDASVKVRNFCCYLVVLGWDYILWWNYVVLQKSEVWTPGSVRNPEAYILKDQVFTIKKLVCFKRSSLLSSQICANCCLDEQVTLTKITLLCLSMTFTAWVISFLVYITVRPDEFAHKG